MNQKLTRNVGLKAGKIMDPSNQNWNLFDTQHVIQPTKLMIVMKLSNELTLPTHKKKNGQNGFPSKHLTL